MRHDADDAIISPPGAPTLEEFIFAFHEDFPLDKDPAVEIVLRLSRLFRMQAILATNSQTGAVVVLDSAPDPPKINLAGMPWGLFFADVWKTPEKGRFEVLEDRIPSEFAERGVRNYVAFPVSGRTERVAFLCNAPRDRLFTRSHHELCRLLQRLTDEAAKHIMLAIEPQMDPREYLLQSLDLWSYEAFADWLKRILKRSHSRGQTEDIIFALSKRYGHQWTETEHMRGQAEQQHWSETVRHIHAQAYLALEKKESARVAASLLGEKASSLLTNLSVDSSGEFSRGHRIRGNSSG